MTPPARWSRPRALDDKARAYESRLGTSESAASTQNRSCTPRRIAQQLLGVILFGLLLAMAGVMNQRDVLFRVSGRRLGAMELRPAKGHDRLATERAAPLLQVEELCFELAALHWLSALIVD